MESSVTPSSTARPEAQKGLVREGSWLFLVLLFFAGWTLIYANRTVLSPLLAILGKEWGLSRAILGLLNSAFFLAYSALQIPSGILADRLGRSAVLAKGYWLHGFGALLSGLVPGFGPLLVARAITGLGQGTYYSSQFALASERLPEGSKSLGLALINTGMAVGTALGWALSSALVYRLGWPWRWPLLLLGLVTLSEAALLSAFVRDTQARGAVRQHSIGERLTPHPGWRLLVRPSALLAYLAMFCSMYGFFVFLTWLPYYLQSERGLPGDAAGALAALMPLAAVPGGVIVGRWADAWGRHRLLLSLLFLLSAASIWTVAAVPTTFGLVLGIGLYGLSGKLVGEPLLIRLVSEANRGTGNLATVLGTLNFAGTFAMVTAPWLTGVLVDRSGHFQSAFFLATALQAIAFLAVLAMPQGNER